MHIIYLTTNNINGKIYIGQHHTDKDDNYKGSGKIIKLAFKKYGKKQFSRVILERCEKNVVSERETYWIKKYNSTNPKIGYNITLGGLGPRLFGEANGNYGNYWTDEQKKSLSDKMVGRYDGENNPMYNKTLSDDSKMKRLNTIKENKSYHKSNHPYWAKMN